VQEFILFRAFGIEQILDELRGNKALIAATQVTGDFDRTGC
jgi:hypothetical protein